MLPSGGLSAVSLLLLLTLQLARAGTWLSFNQLNGNEVHAAFEEYLKATSRNQLPAPMKHIVDECYEHLTKREVRSPHYTELCNFLGMNRP